MDDLPEIALTEEQEKAVEIEKLRSAFLSGANWFFWIAGLSLVNSLIILFSGEWSFVVGLGATQIVDGIASVVAEDVEPNMVMIVRIVGLALDVMIALVFVLFGWLARKRMGWAFILGMLLYFVDGLIFLLVQDWLSIGFHAFALFCIFGGYASMKRLVQLEGNPEYAAVSNQFEPS
jgi:hypothetical protein